MKSEVPIFHPRSLPCAGIRTAVDPLVLGDGEFQELDNIRLKAGLPTVREGLSAAIGTVVEDGDIRGFFQSKALGWHEPTSDWVTIVAVRVGSATRLLTSIDLTSWTEVTASSGKYGNTRIGSNGLVRFASVPDPFVPPGTYNPFLVLAVCDLALPRLVFNASEGSCAIIEDVPSQATAQSCPVEAHVIQYAFNVWGGTWTHTDSSGGLTSADLGSAPNRMLRVSIDPSVAEDDWCTLHEFSGLQVLPEYYDPQVVIGIKTDYAGLLNNIKIDLHGGVLWDPVNVGDYPESVIIDYGHDGYTLWVFEHKAVQSITWFNELTFTWVETSAQAPSSIQTLDIFMIGRTIASPVYDDLELAVTNYNQATRTESPGVVYNNYTTQSIKNCGGPRDSKLTIPPKTGKLRAAYYARFDNTSADDLAKGIDRINFYYRDPKSPDSRFRYWKSDTLATYTDGAWEYYWSFEGELGRVRGMAGPSGNFASLPEVFLPDAYQIAIPKASEACFVNERLLIGGGGGSTKGFYISEFRNPFRMRSFLSLEPDQPSFVNMDSESIQAIVPVPASQFGTWGVAVLSDRNCYLTGGIESAELSRLSRVSSYGTLSPYSVTEHKGTLYYLDSDMQIRTFAGGSTAPLSRNRVDNLLASIPGSRRPYVSAAFHNETLYMAFTPAGETTNTKTLVWDADTNAFTTDTPAKSMAGLLRWFSSADKEFRLIGLGKDGDDLKAYRYDTPGQLQDLGSADIPVAIRTRRWLGERGSERFAMGRVMALMDDSNGGSLTTTRTFIPRGNTSTSSLSTDVALGDVWRYDFAIPPTLSPATSQGSGAGGDLRLAGSLKGGTNLYSLLVEMEGRGKGADA